MEAIGDILELIYPNYCSSCLASVSETEIPICVQCRMELPVIVSNPFSNHDQLSKKFAGLLPLKYCIAFLKFEKGGITQRLLHALKYGKKPEVGIVLGQLLASQLITNGLNDNFDFILPIPLHSAKLKKRGYNQAMELAKGIASGFKTETNEDILIRTIATETQTRKGKVQRILNVGEVFGVNPSLKHLLEGKHILMVDDVITTGSTMEACAKLLIHEPIASLSIATIAIA